MLGNYFLHCTPNKRHHAVKKSLVTKCRIATVHKESAVRMYYDLLIYFITIDS